VILLATLLFLFGFGSDSGDALERLRELLPTLVADAERADHAVQVIDDTLELRGETVSRFEELRAELRLVDADHAATRADYEDLSARYDAIWADAQAGLVERRMRLRELLTREEWAAMNAALDRGDG
jgi:hypothetical protein